jgi:HSP20 family protein
MERSYGSFHREIPLPAEIAPDKAEAAFIKGILNITLPKTVESQRTVKRIHVRSE